MALIYTTVHRSGISVHGLLVLVLLVGVGIGCGDPEDENNEEEQGPQALVSPHAWAMIPASQDPVDDAPDTALCDVENGTKVEALSDEEAFGVSTANCEYVAVGQTTLGPISSGDTVFVRAWHFDLTAPTDAEAHLAVAIDDETIWEERIPIPSDGSGLLTSEWTATRDIPTGSDIVFHAHNHGNNEYYLIEVSRQ